MTKQEELIQKNQGLVYYITNYLRLGQDEDIVEIGKIGLAKAAGRFDPEKNIKFATFAVPVIKNEIFMFLRKNKKYKNNISLNMTIGMDKEGNELTIEDKLKDSKCDIEEYVTSKNEVEDTLNFIFNFLPSKERYCILKYIAGQKQRTMEKSLNVSRSYISRIISKAQKRIEINTKQEGDYKMSISSDTYKLVFSSKNVSKFNSFLADQLRKMTSEDFMEFKVICEGGKFTIILPADATSFSIIADLISKNDEYSVSMTRSKTSESETIKKDINKEQYDERNDSNNEIKSSDDTKKVPVKMAKRGTGKLIQEYILSKDKFTIDEIGKQFPEINKWNVYNAIKILKEEGKVNKITQREYEVIKE